MPDLWSQTTWSRNKKVDSNAFFDWTKKSIFFDIRNIKKRELTFEDKN